MSISENAGAVVFAKDINRVARFYEEVFSIPVVHFERDHVVLESPLFQLVVHAIPKKIAESIEITAPPTRRTATPIKLFFFVTSIAEARTRAVALGGELDPKKSEWEARGFELATAMTRKAMSCRFERMRVDPSKEQHDDPFNTHLPLVP